LTFKARLLASRLALARRHPARSFRDFFDPGACA
jgi:hypothetical protein